MTAEVTFLHVALGKSFSQTSSLCPNMRQVITDSLVTNRVVMLGGEGVCPEDPASMMTMDIINYSYPSIAGSYIISAKLAQKFVNP